MADLDKNNDVVEEKSSKEAKSEKKPAKKNDKNKVPFGEKVKKFFREYKSELKKIVWYSPKQTAKSTVLVVITIVVAAAVIGGLDFLFSTGLTWLGRVI